MRLQAWTDWRSVGIELEDDLQTVRSAGHGSYDEFVGRPLTELLARIVADRPEPVAPESDEDRLARLAAELEGLMNLLGVTEI